MITCLEEFAFRNRGHRRFLPAARGDFPTLGTSALVADWSQILRILSKQFILEHFPLGKP